MAANNEEEKKVDIIGTDPACLTFVLRDEDHTLGNALRYVLSRSVDVKFCGYSIPHPSENIMNIRVETYGKNAADLFRQGLQDLHDMADHLRSCFSAENERVEVIQRAR